MRTKDSRQLISTDVKSNIANYKFTFSAEIAPICKDDLVLLPRKLSRELGGIGPLVLCYKISTALHFVDAVTMQTAEMDGISYWSFGFNALCSRPQLRPFVVLNIEQTDFDLNVSRAAAKEKFRLV